MGKETGFAVLRHPVQRDFTPFHSKTMELVQNDEYNLRHGESEFALADGFGRGNEVQSLWDE